MNNIGIIGYGSIGSMFTNGFIKKKLFSPSQISVFEMSKDKIDEIKKKWPEINICDSNKALAAQCDQIFICVKPNDTISVFKEIQNELNGDTHIISVAAGVTISSIEKIYSGKITRVIPSFASEIYEGVSLVCHNKDVSYAEAKSIEKILSEISLVKRIKEEDFPVATDLTSCMPGFIAYIFEAFFETGVKHSGLTKEEAEEMVITTLYGTSKLLYDRQIGFNEVIKRVATKGGITEVGINVLKESLPNTFDEVLKKTLEKFEKTQEDTDKLFSKNS